MPTKRLHVKNILKINAPKTRLCVSNDNLIALSAQKNYLFDISDGRAPKLINNFILNKDDYANRLLRVVNKKAYFDIGYTGVEVVDLQGENKLSSFGLIKDVEIGAKAEFFGDLFLITNPNTPTIYRIASPAEFDVAYRFSNSRMIDLLVFGDYLYAALLNEGIKIYDIAEPGNPRQVSSLSINAVKLIAKNSRTILAECSDNAIYILDISNPPNITIVTKIKIPGPIAADSIICKDNYLFVRFMRKMVSDTTYAFDIHDENNPKRIFSFNSKGMPLYIANDKVLVFMGIKDWDGVSAISNYTASFYKVFSVQPDKITHIDDIVLDGIWFGSIVLLNAVIYIARHDGIYVYEVQVD